MSNDHEHKVCETRLRTALKGVTAKILEIALDFTILDIVFHRPAESLGIAIGLEVVCYALNYINERGWNRIMWGRKVIDIPVNMDKSTQTLNKSKAFDLASD
jgi:hypothetical protein